MSAVLFHEAVLEFRKWESNQYRIVGGFKRPYTPAVRKPPQPQPKKARRDLKPPLGGRVLQPLLTCACGKIYSSKQNKKRCHKCYTKHGSKQRSCVDCGAEYRSIHHPRCQKCRRRYYAERHKPCKCGRPWYCAGKCYRCYERMRSKISPAKKAHAQRNRKRHYERLKSTAEGREKLRAKSRRKYQRRKTKRGESMKSANRV